MSNAQPVTSPPTDEALRERLRENARFLKRKGWSKSAVLEEAAAALIASQAARIAELEAGIRKWASECGECRGSGKTTVRGMCGGVEMDCDDQPCPDCEDIRELLP